MSQLDVFATPETNIYGQILELLGLPDSIALHQLASDAGWDYSRLCKETETPGMRERFESAVRVGQAAIYERTRRYRMQEVLANGPNALAGLSVDALADLATDVLLSKLAREYDPQEHGGRLVCGPTGIGKSVAGIAALVRVGRARESSSARLWVRAFDLPNARLAHGLGSGESPLVASAVRAKFLVLDDLGWESKRAGADDVVSEVIASRYDAGLVTYATTGLRLEQFQQRYGSAIVRRLVEAGGLKGKVVDLWPSKAGS